MATPLLAALVVVEVTDVVFAVDSVPAILAVSREPFIVFSSNAFAILGLRAMYFLLGGARERFHYLSHALGAILVFVGIKMMVSHWWHMPTIASLAVIVAILGAAIVFSIRKTRREATDVLITPSGVASAAGGGAVLADREGREHERDAGRPGEGDPRVGAGVATRCRARGSRR